MAGTLTLSGNVVQNNGTSDICTDPVSAAETYNEIVVQELVLATSASDTAVSLGGLSANAEMVIIVPTYGSSGTPSNYFTVKVNGGTEDIPYGKLAVLGGNNAAGVGIDSFSVSNPDAANELILKIYACNK